MNKECAQIKTEASRLIFLDILRGFAALYVVIHHIGLMPNPPLVVPEWLGNLIGFGGSGVTLFFIISGFSMCLTWNRNADLSFPIAKFYINRFARIAPLFYIWLLIAVIRFSIGKPSIRQPSISEIACNICFTFSLYEKFQLGIVWASWTIGVEMVFYLLFPLIRFCQINNLLKTSTLCLFVLVIVYIFNTNSLVGDWIGKFVLLRSLLTGIGFLTVMPVFLLGSIAFYLYEILSETRFYFLRRFVKIFCLATGAIALCKLASTNRVGLAFYYTTAVAYSIFLVGFSLSCGRSLIGGLLGKIGLISYSIYLNHPPLVYLLFPVFKLIYKCGWNSVLSFVICFFVTQAVLMPISYLTYINVEVPGGKVIKRFLDFNKLKSLWFNLFKNKIQ